MSWCLVTPAALAALVGLAALVAPAPRLSRSTPGRMLRGCAAALCLMAALALAALALALAEVRL